ncbi:hypothetical protein [Shinella sp.]|uniref:hypothetical protein n=1 Tax=Shinella sp. TaxID=1870904 RepID=UPI0028AC279C|nr:hypothetical protein [Shinella sp.]
MTAVNVLRLEDSVHLFTDTRASAGGLFVAHVPKVNAIPHLSAAIATRGSLGALELISRAACDWARSFEDLKDAFRTNLKDLFEFKWPNPRDAEVWKQPLDIFVVGWSKAGPEAFSIFTHEEHGFPAFELVEIPFVCLTPTVSPLSLDHIGTSTDPVSLMPDIMQQQCDLNPGNVGGFMQHTLVIREGIQTRVLGKMQPREKAPAVNLPEAFARHLVAVDT